MVGIVGIVTEKNEKIKKLLPKMSRAIEHRDTHKTEYYINDGIGLGRVHLGILNPESQPIFNEDKTLCIVMDGEIYDYQSMKDELVSKGHKFVIDNDPEFILHLYEEYGNDFVKSLNGSFSVAIWNEKSKILLMANDRFGLRPIYYTNDNGYLLFGSEIKAIIQDDNFKRIVNDRAVADFFSFGYVTGNKTLIKGIELLPPGSIMISKDGGFLIENYWDFDFNEKFEDYSEDYYIEQLSNALSKAVNRRMKGKVGVLLSGGLDSRTILGFVNKTCDKKINTFTYGKLNCNDSRIAKIISDILRTHHHYFELDPYKTTAENIENVVYLTEGMLNVFDSNWLLSNTCEKIAEFSDIFLHGYIGDNTTGNRFTGISFSLIDFRNNFHIFKSINEGLSNDIMKNLFNETYFIQIKKELGLTKDHINQIGDKIENPVDRLMFYLLTEYDRRDILIGSSCSRNIMEDRFPFTDNDYIDLILKIPNKYKLGQRIYKKMILSKFPELREVPRDSTGRPIYESTFEYKSKKYINFLMQKFFSLELFRDGNKNTIDYNNLIRCNKNLKEYISKILLDKRSIERNYFNTEFIKRIIDEHDSGKKDYSSLIGLVLTFELWNRQFIDEKNEIVDKNQDQNQDDQNNQKNEDDQNDPNKKMR